MQNNEEQKKMITRSDNLMKEYLNENEKKKNWKKLFRNQKKKSLKLKFENFTI